MGATGLVTFDLDGTLLRGRTVCETLAVSLGRSQEMRSFEAYTEERDIARAREEMAKWYQALPRERLLSFLKSADWAPGAKRGIEQLQRAGVEVAIASITWDFAVAWFAQRLGVRHTLGTGLANDGTILHVWGSTKAEWSRALASKLAVPYERTAAVGDSSSDLPMLRVAALRFFVGPEKPQHMDCVHVPRGDIQEIGESILAAWAS